MSAQPDYVTLPGVVCETCQSPELRVIVPGTVNPTPDLIGMLTPGRPDRGWCCIDHARGHGLPAIGSEVL